MDFTIRPFELGDHEAVNRLCNWAWWPQRSAEGWRWLAEGPPGALNDGETGPSGWVCESEKGVLAFVGNCVQRFAFEDRTFAGATGHTLLVDPRLRGASRDMLRRFVRQPNRFARYTFNANDRSAPLYKHFGMHPWPEGLSAVKYVWRTDWTGVASERALRWFNGLSGHSGSRDGGERFLSDRPWTGSVGWRAPGVRQMALSEIDGRFDRLWAELRGDGRLLAFRDAASLRWRCSDPDLSCPPILLGYEVGGRLAGYLLAFFSKGSEVERPAMEIIDLVALRSVEMTAISALLRTLLLSARRFGAARVRLQTVNPELDQVLAPFALAKRQYRHNHCHIHWGEDTDERMKQAWFATPYDGDYSFCLRPPPKPALDGDLTQTSRPPAAREVPAAGDANWVYAP